jgi:hypothetical protein
MLENIKQMYDDIYDEMVDPNLAIELVEHTFMDKYSNTVDEESRFSMKQNIRITYPSYIMFADESGCSTSQKKDGHVGGQQFVVESGMVSQIVGSATDKKFTLLPFTSPTGEAVCCVIIFQSKQDGVHATWTTGIDHTVQPVLSRDGTDIILELNLGKRKYYCGGPK